MLQAVVPHVRSFRLLGAAKLRGGKPATDRGSRTAVSGAPLPHAPSLPDLRRLLRLFRVSFHWSEADPALGGTVPPELTERSFGTNGSCAAPAANNRVASRWTPTSALQRLHHPFDRRPSVCAASPASWEFGAASAQCDKARLAHGLAVLT